MAVANQIVGVSDHCGWAVLVTMGPGGAFVERRRVALVDDDLPKLPHHHDAQGLPLDEAEALIGRVRGSAERHASAALDAVAAAVAPRITGIAIRRCPPLPPTVAQRLSNYQAQNVADTVMYRTALAEAAQARGWQVHWYEVKTVVGLAAAVLRVADFDAHFLQMRAALGPPWDKDHKLAMAAAIVAGAADGG